MELSPCTGWSSKACPTAVIAVFMLDLSPMILLRHSRGLRVGDAGSGQCRVVSLIKMVNRSAFLALFLLLLGLAVSSAQQSQGTSPDTGQNSNTWDCTDPLLAT